MHTATKKTAMNTSQSHSYSNFNGTHSSNSLLLKGQCHEIFDHFLFGTKNSAYSIYGAHVESFKQEVGVGASKATTLLARQQQQHPRQQQQHPRQHHSSHRRENSLPQNGIPSNGPHSTTVYSAYSNIKYSRLVLTAKSMKHYPDSRTVTPHAIATAALAL